MPVLKYLKIKNPFVTTSIKSFRWEGLLEWRDFFSIQIYDRVVYCPLPYTNVYTHVSIGWDL
jgi:hypothetical protein